MRAKRDWTSSICLCVRTFHSAHLPKRLMSLSPVLQSPSSQRQHSHITWQNNPLEQTIYWRHLSARAQRSLLNETHTVISSDNTSLIGPLPRLNCLFDSNQNWLVASIWCILYCIWFCEERLIPLNSTKRCLCCHMLSWFTSTFLISWLFWCQLCHRLFPFTVCFCESFRTQGNKDSGKQAKKTNETNKAAACFLLFNWPEHRMNYLWNKLCWARYIWKFCTKKKKKT